MATLEGRLFERQRGSVTPDLRLWAYCMTFYIPEYYSVLDSPSDH